MANGRFRTFDEFGSPTWNSTLSPALQRAAVQSAFDSGEPLLMPCGETVDIDGPLIALHSLHLMGHGADITNRAAALSQFRIGAAGIDLIHVLANNVVLERLNLHADAMGGRGIVIGDGVSPDPAGTILNNISTASNLLKGVDLIGGQETSIIDCWLNGQDSAICVNNGFSSDMGDNRIRGGKLNAYGPQGACLRFLSGGGLTVDGGTKFLNAFNHIKMDWRKGGSAGLTVKGCHFENCTSSISVDIDGNKGFERVIFSGNNWGNSSVAIVVRNFQGVPWLAELVVSDNVVKVFGTAPIPAFDFGSVAQLSFDGNIVNGSGIASAGIIVRKPCTGSIGINTIRNTTGPAIQNVDGAAVSISPFQG